MFMTTCSLAADSILVCANDWSVCGVHGWLVLAGCCFGFGKFPIVKTFDRSSGVISNETGMFEGSFSSLMLSSGVRPQEALQGETLQA